MTTGAPQSSDRADAAGRAGLAGALIVLAVGLVAGTLENQMRLLYALPVTDDYVTHGALALTWPWWVLPRNGAGFDATAITLVPLLLAALTTYVVDRLRLPRRPQTAGAVFWTTWRAAVVGGAVGSLLHVVPVTALLGYVPFIGLDQSAWWLLGYGAGWGALAGVVAGWGAVLVTRSFRRPEGPPPL